jgi:hypothetical protein
MSSVVRGSGALIEGSAPSLPAEMTKEGGYRLQQTNMKSGVLLKSWVSGLSERKLHAAQQIPVAIYTVIQVGLLGALLSCGIASASAVITPSGDPGRAAGNPFDYSNINIVSNSATYNSGSDIRDIFGGTFSTLEAPGRTIFADGQATYQITFTTLRPTALTGYSLYLAEDGTTLNRSATNFQLKADGNLISNVAIVPSGQSYTSLYGGSGAIKISDSFAGVTATTFQALFTANVGQFSGIRVFELDANGASVFGGAATGVPEPSTMYLTCLGGLLLATRFRWRPRI